MARGNGGGWPPRRRTDDPLEALGDLGPRLGRVLARVNPWSVLAGLAVLYALAGLYIVAPDEAAVVLRFGRAVREAGPGPHYHVPWPVETVLKVPVTRILKEEIGFRTVSPGPPARYRSIDAESLMLTGDHNIVDLDFVVQYRVARSPNGLRNFLFNVHRPRQAVRAAAEASMREVVGASAIDDALTEGKERIQAEAERLLQGILDRYGAGIEIVTVKLQDVSPPAPVSDAFKDVINAQQDKARLVNEARGYRNDIVPKARGSAAEIVNRAEAYRTARVRDAEGQSARFLALLEEYRRAPAVTRRRLYLETVERILPRLRKVVLDENLGQSLLPHLSLGPPPDAPRAGAPARPAR